VTFAARLHGLSPLAVLGRGYALCWSDAGRTLVREATPGLVGQQVSVTLARGSLVCDVRAAMPSPAPRRAPELGRAAIDGEDP
jgi:exodeoxyribonuclease VII large subunit